MLNVIKDILLKIVSDIDAGTTEINEQDALNIADFLSRYNHRDKRMSKYMACKYLNVSRATFDNYVRDGKIPRGTSEQGFKELSWKQEDLDSFIRESKKSQ